jgi:hypothetical protein
METAQLDDWRTEFPEANAVVAVITPEPLPTDTPTPSPTLPSSVVGQTACDHPYFPMRAGATWNYSDSTGESFTWSISNVEGDTNSATAEMINRFSSGQVTYHWQCDTNGLVSYEFGSIAGDTSGQIASFEIQNASGIFLPAADLLVPGYAWANSYELILQFSEAAGSGSGTFSWSGQYTVDSIETVTVGDQTFEGLRISSQSNGAMTISLGADIPAQTIPIDSTATYLVARGVGIVHFESQSQGISSSTDLTGYTIP